MKLAISNISKLFKGKSALQNVSFELAHGVYGLLGPNGAGKTTLLKIIADILRSTSGSVRLDDMPIAKMGEQYRDLLGYMPQNLGIYRDFTAEQYLLYIAALKGLQEKSAKEAVHLQLNNVGLADTAKQKLKTFSGGMLRRIGIAQTLLNNPKILLLDEPMEGLDPQERIRLRNILSELSEHCIIILSTHIVSDIELIAGKVILLRDGKLLAFDTVKNLLKGLDGTVWTAYLSQEELSSLPQGSIAGNAVQENGKLKVRLISDCKPFDGAIPVSPTVEDLYLFHFQGRDTV